MRQPGAKGFYFRADAVAFDAGTTKVFPLYCL
jgi:hypothetical protein